MSSDFTAIMALHFFNTLTKKLEEFVPIKKGHVTMYNCGPTVYSTAHIGNFSAYLMADLIRRYLEYKGLKVKQVMNITDVGHLVADQDSGEDKMEKAAREEKIDPWAIARKYEEIFHADRRKLRIKDAFAYPHATETVKEQVAIIEDLLKKDFAYETDDGVYFDVTHFKNYGKLSGNSLDQVLAGARVDVNEHKKHPADFALWKKCVGENEHHIMRWPSPWGEGFPGWHIECSAMSMMHLGSQIDIHTGGEDNIFPHHECEIAQSEAHTGKQFANYWLHRKHILVDGEKMSKSKKNFYTISDIEAKGFDALAFRFAMLSSHYRQSTNFSWKLLEDATKNRERIQSFIDELLSDPFAGPDDSIMTYRKRFEDFMDDDLNVSGALSVIFDLLHDVRKDRSLFSSEVVLAFLTGANMLFDVFHFEKSHLTAEITEKISQREKARAEKDFALSDTLRDELLDLGIEVKDTPEGMKWRKIS